MDELGPGLNGVRAEVTNRAEASADAVATLDNGHIETCLLELARGGHSRHPGADHEDVGAVGSVPMVFFNHDLTLPARALI